MNILIYCFLVFSLSFAQISHGGKPHYSDSLDEVPRFLTSLENKVIYNRDNLPQYFIFGD